MNNPDAAERQEPLEEIAFTDRPDFSRDAKLQVREFFEHRGDEIQNIHGKALFEISWNYNIIGKEVEQVQGSVCTIARDEVEAWQNFIASGKYDAHQQNAEKGYTPFNKNDAEDLFRYLNVKRLPGLKVLLPLLIEGESEKYILGATVTTRDSEGVRVQFCFYEKPFTPEIS